MSNLPCTDRSGGPPATPGSHPTSYIVLSILEDLWKSYVFSEFCLGLYWFDPSFLSWLVGGCLVDLYWVFSILCLLGVTSGVPGMFPCYLFVVIVSYYLFLPWAQGTIWADPGRVGTSRR